MSLDIKTSFRNDVSLKDGIVFAVWNSSNTYFFMRRDEKGKGRWLKIAKRAGLNFQTVPNSKKTQILKAGNELIRQPG